MLAIAVLLVVVHLMGYSDGGTETTCPDGATSASIRLRRKLFCDYDINDRPAKFHTNATDVQLRLEIKFLLFHENWNTLSVHTWTIWRWQDAHLVWNKDEYEDLETIRVSSSEIWVPDVALYTGSDMNDNPSRMAETSCHLGNKGIVWCVAPTVHSALCSPDITKWPFDTHNCSMKIGSWTYMNEELNLTLKDKPFQKAVDYTPNRDWELLSTDGFMESQTFSNKTYSWASFSLVLKRHSGGHAATVFIPALVLAVVTLAIFWIEPHNTERLLLIGFNVLCHCMYLQYLGAHLPSNSDKYPIILLFYRDSLLMVALSMFVTLAARKMADASSAPPGWITTITYAVQTTLPGQILLSGGVADVKSGNGENGAPAIVETSRKYQGWLLFAVLLDRVFFVIYLLTFVILLCAFVP